MCALCRVIYDLSGSISISGIMAPETDKDTDIDEIQIYRE